MILEMKVNREVLAESIAHAAEYEEIVDLFLRIDEIQSDSVFTDMVVEAFHKRAEEIDS